MKPKIVDYRKRASKMRAESELGENEAIAKLELDRSPSNPDYVFYQDLLARIRTAYPLINTDACPVSSSKTM